MDDDTRPTPALIPDFGLRRDLRATTGQNLPNRPTPWPEWVENCYFVIWMKCGCSVRQTVRQAEALWSAITEEPFQPIPYQTLQAWVHKHHWQRKKTETVAAAYPGIVMDALAHLALAQLKAAENTHAAVNGEFLDMDEKKERNWIEWNKLALLAGGGGTFGTRDRVAQPVRALAMDTEVDFSAMTAQEMARWEAEAIARSRNTRPDERKR